MVVAQSLGEVFPSFQTPLYNSNIQFQKEEKKNIKVKGFIKGVTQKIKGGCSFTIPSVCLF